VWDYNDDNTRRLSAMLQKAVRFVKIGYVPQWTRIESRPTQDIDVLFYGSVNARRQFILDGLRVAGLSVYHAYGVYGQERDELIARSKIVLNMHYYEPGTFEIVRVSYLLANRKAVVTEANPGETVDEELSGAMVAVPYDGLVEACKELVANDTRRHALEEAGFTAFSARDEAAILKAAMGEPTSKQATNHSPDQDHAKEFDMAYRQDLLGSLLSTRNRYLNTLESALTGTLYGDPPNDTWSKGEYNSRTRELGRDWPALAQTMIGTVRMRNLRQICEAMIMDEIDGDFIETGVWRGGACIYMKAILDAYGDRRRRVFVADSFQGLPSPDPAKYPADHGDKHHSFSQLAVSRQDVEDNFRRYGLLDDRVVFLEGWFKDTLPAAPIKSLSVLRLDGDMYESTIQALDALYHKVSRGGAVIVDDYFLGPCETAVNEFRARHRIDAPLLPIDGMAVWWRCDHAPIVDSR
jgi:hypothetical protein